MVISFDPASGNSVRPVRPPFCRCGKFHFHVHGYYWRAVARVLITRFICLACRHTISMIPNHCVPYKHHPVSVINPVLDRMMLDDQSDKQDVHISAGIHPSTAYRWRQQFFRHFSILATEGAQRLGIPSVSGTATTVYQSVKAHFSNHRNAFFKPFQVLLCRQPPPIGIFRSFSF